MTSKLQSQIKQSKPFRTAHEELFVNLLRSCSAFLTQFTELLRTHELSQPQYNVLRILRGAGVRGLPSGEIGVRMVGRDPDVTRVIDRMEASGLVMRERSATDRRVITVRITVTGRNLVNKLDEPVLSLHTRQFGHMTANELTMLNALLERSRDEDGERSVPIIP